MVAAPKAFEYECDGYKGLLPGPTSEGADGRPLEFESALS